MSRPTPEEIRDVLVAIAEGYPVRGEDDRYVIVDNPDRDAPWDDPCLVIDTAWLWPGNECPECGGLGAREVAECEYVPCLECEGSGFLGISPDALAKREEAA